MKVAVKKVERTEMQQQGVLDWPIWEKEVSRFDWHYDDIEECYLLQGQVVVETNDGQRVEFGQGDFVTFPKGLSCVWDIKSPVRKHYNFR